MLLEYRVNTKIKQNKSSGGKGSGSGSGGGGSGVSVSYITYPDQPSNKKFRPVPIKRFPVGSRISIQQFNKVRFFLPFYLSLILLFLPLFSSHSFSSLFFASLRLVL
jgi:hypothetical protein